MTNEKLFYELQALIENLEIKSDTFDAVYGADYMKRMVLKLVSEFIKIKVEADIDELSRETPDFTTGMTCTLAKDVLIYTRSIEDYDKFKKYIRSEAIREFAENVKTEINERFSDEIQACNPHFYLVSTLVDDLVKEMTEGENGKKNNKKDQNGAKQRHISRHKG